ncbi:hypothetical protein BpHYR1_039607 [Brachionus plicatilis]|uniref:Uncharacterized protein n=1 Tax=Brachionus plicatilis TaxID=10195 RepID=A0A3M7PKQ1_BRAPC|nr:hypothetical protein BpHYR1_039607 [Brachionus plicatilis]
MCSRLWRCIIEQGNTFEIQLILFLRKTISIMFSNYLFPSMRFEDKLHFQILDIKYGNQQEIKFNPEKTQFIVIDEKLKDIFLYTYSCLKVPYLSPFH